MEKPKRLKPYKSSEPYDTVAKIREILKSLDIFIIEDSYKSPTSHTCTNRIRLGDERLEPLKIGANGKGMTARYALASAYGEFMERLQNYAPKSWFYMPENKDTDFPSYSEFLNSCDAVSSFLYSPDEKWLHIDEILSENALVFQDMRICKGLSTDSIRTMLSDFSYQGRLCCVPFYSVFEDKEVFLPYKIIRMNAGTNGMCAGNTPKEALIQGLSEIYERFAQQTIMFGDLPCPNIPLSLFEGSEVYNKLERMIERGLDVQVLDMSCGMGLPVVGLKLLTENGEISIHPGADPSPVTALERCLTETYQCLEDGQVLFKFKKEAMNPPDDSSSEADILAFYDNIKKSFSDGSGAYPAHVQTPDWTFGFTGFSHPVSVSDDDDFQYLLDIAKNTGHNIYIRDNSYLGIPAYAIFIPGMSDLSYFKGPKSKNYLDYGRELATLCSLPYASLKEVRHLKDYLEQDRKKTFATVSFADCFPAGVSDYLPKGIDNPDLLQRALQGQIAYLEGHGKPVFTAENWPICCQCDACAYRNECRQKDLIRLFNPVRESYRKNIRPQSKKMFQ